jgi:tRNA(fMet)-specific endonuclease VapC
MEEIVYDTNQLISFLKSGKESVNGFTTIFNIIEFPKALDLKELGVIYPTLDDYDEGLKISAALLTEGKPLPAVDILVAAMCVRRNLTLRTLDKHFTNVKKVRTNFKLEFFYKH